MKTMDQVGVIFVNALTARGIMNGVVNLSFETYNFTPTDAGTVEVDPVTSCRLRMDTACLYQMRNALNDLIEMIEKSEKGVVGVGKTEEPATTTPAKRVSPEKTQH